MEEVPTLSVVIIYRQIQVFNTFYTMINRIYFHWAAALISRNAADVKHEEVERTQTDRARCHYAR
ncbi:hypothetical protein SBA3_1510021 [Candidatus Sulfopaludibacter sp. SbA3]|nr:hypothetical protein SBA3_1510021 [Candidatus Sulfopaludibacter sp. SbA3]